MPLALTAARPLEGELVDDLPEGVRRLKQLRDGTFVGGKTPPGRSSARAKGFERIPRIRRARLTGRGLATLGAAAAVPMVAHDTKRLHDHPERRPSVGRLAAGAQLGPYHALAASKPGHKSRAVAAMAPAAAAGYVANQYAGRAMMPHLGAVQHAMAYGNPVGSHLRAAGKAALPATAAAYTAGALMTRHNAAMGRYKEQTMTKSDSKHGEASGGRYAAGMFFGGAHGLVAGRKGHKLGAGALEAAPMLAAAPLASLGVAHGKPALQAAGIGIKYGGRYAAVGANQRQGKFKPQAVTASKRLVAIRKDALPTNTRYVVARGRDGRYAGNGTDLVYVKVVTSPTTSRVVEGNGSRGLSGGRAPVSKAGGMGAGFAGALDSAGLSRSERVINRMFTGGVKNVKTPEQTAGLLSTKGGRNRRAVQRGVDMVANQPKPSAVPRTSNRGLLGRLPQLNTATSGRRIS